MSCEENTFTVIPPFRLEYSIVVVAFKSLERWQRMSPSPSAVARLNILILIQYI